MNISLLMVHDQQVEESRFKRKSQDDKMGGPFEGGSSKGRLDIQDKPRFRNRVYNQVLSKFPKARDDRVSNPNPKKGRYTSSPTRSLLVPSVQKVIHVNA